MLNSKYFRWVVYIVIALIVLFVGFRVLAAESCQVLDVAGHFENTTYVETTYKCPAESTYQSINTSTDSDKPCRSANHYGQSNHHHYADRIVDVEGYWNQEWVADTYKDVACEESCTQECGYEGGEVADGNGGYKTCEATVACEVEPEPEPVVTTHKDDNDGCDKPGDVNGFRRFGGSLLKWNNVHDAKFVDITAYGADKTTALWKLRTQDDGKFDFGGLRGSWFKARGMNNCDLGDWTHKIPR